MLPENSIKLDIQKNGNYIKFLQCIFTIEVYRKMQTEWQTK